MIGRAEFEAAKDGVLFVNTARGGVVEETALVEPLETGMVGAAGLDVFEPEPLLADHPLGCHDQAILSPHTAGLTEGAAERIAGGSAQNILDCFDEPIYPQLIVYRERLARVET